MRMLILTILLLLAHSSLALATAQHPEKLLHDGQERPLRSLPLEAYLKKHPHDEVRTAGGGRSTALWRGYVGTWSIKNDKLHLVKIEHEHLVKNGDDFKFEWRDYPLEKVFPKQKGPIPADWYTGLLSVPDGELLEYVHMGFASMFEKELLFLIEEGVVKKTATIKNLDADPYTSVTDRRWVAVGDPPKEPGEPGDWVDARLLMTTVADAAIKAGKLVKTRGIISDDIDDEGKVIGHLLYVPGTQETVAVIISLGKLPPDLAAVTRHAEIEGVVLRQNDQLKMKVQSARTLKPGETMHASTFKDAIGKMQKADRAKLIREKSGDE